MGSANFSHDVHLDGIDEHIWRQDGVWSKVPSWRVEVTGQGIWFDVLRGGMVGEVEIEP